MSTMESILPLWVRKMAGRYRESISQIPALGVLGSLAVLTTLLFWMTDLDLEILGWFFDPGQPENAWPLGNAQPWRFFYQAAPFLTALPALTALLLLILRRHFACLRPRAPAALFIVLCFALGPGLTVNLVFKDHWVRPRPRQVTTFGGQQEYLPPLAIAQVGHGKSFPCGHSSVGFTYGAFYFVWRKRRPQLAAAVLTGSLALGALMGIGRMAAGAHFFSDVLWSGFLPLGVAAVLSSRLRVAETLNLPISSRSLLSGAIARCEPVLLPLFISLFIGGACLATPFSKPFLFEVPPSDLQEKPQSLNIVAPDTAVTVSVTTRPGLHLTIRGETRGFGSPFNDLTTRFSKPEAGRLRYGVQYGGYFTDVETNMIVEISQELLASGISIVQQTYPNLKGKESVRVLAGSAARESGW